MTLSIPRLRMFAGPNGSGKSTLKTLLPPELLGHYLNPDEIEQSIKEKGYFDFSLYGLHPSGEEVAEYFRDSTFLKSKSFSKAIPKLNFSGDRISFNSAEVDSYIASAIVEFLRIKLTEDKKSFTFETVMSHPSKVEFLSKAKQAGYRTYLYYIATADPAINISRVKNRVSMDGHDVPVNKISERYYRSLELLLDAIRNTDRAYIFDNSSDNNSSQHTWIAEITEGKELELKTDVVPAWFDKYVLQRITAYKP